VVNGFFREGEPLKSDAVFSLIPWGTGSDLARSVKAPGKIEEALWVAATGMTLRSDVGLARFTGHDGEDASRLFINSAGFGCNGEVASRANRSSKRLGGTVTFLGATFATLASFKSPRLSLDWSSSDGGGSWEGPFMSAFLMNGSYCGGGMNLAPRGNMHDGKLDLTILPPMGFVGAVAKSWRLFDGSAEKVSGVKVGQVEELRAQAPDGEKVLIELDGEQPGCLPLQASVLKDGLSVRGGWLQSPALKSK